MKHTSPQQQFQPATVMVQPSPPPQQEHLQPATVPVQQQPPPPQMMTVPWSAYRPKAPKIRRIRYRHTMFKVGVGGLFLAVLLFIVGYSVPAWGNKSGLWMSCSYGSCYSNVGSGLPYLDAVRTMETLALVCFIVAVGVELYQDVFKSPPPRDLKIVEILGCCAGVLGLIGVAVYGAKTNTRISYHYGVGYSYTTYIKIQLNWGFGLTCAGCILAIICSILIAFSRIRHAAHTNQALALAGVSVAQSSSGAVPMQPMMSQNPYMQPNPYMTPYPHPYSAYPAPATTSFIAHAPQTAVPSPVAAAQGMPTSHVPAFFVMVQDQAVPVYREMPTAATMMTQATAPVITTEQT